MKQYFVYVRKSTDESDRQVLSIDAQLSIIQDFVQRHGLPVKEIFREAQSAMKPGRPVFNGMIKRLEKNEAAGIIAHKTDRLSRNDVDSAKIFDLMSKGYEVIFVDTPVLNNAVGRATLGMQLVWAKFYSENLSEEVKKGMNQKISQGGWPNYAPLGYINFQGKIIPDDERASFVQRAFEEYAVGEVSLKTLAEILHKDGLRTRKEKKVVPPHLHRILQNPFYYGILRWKEKLLKGTHQPLITYSLWEKAQEVRNSRNRPHPIRYNFPYRGFLKCGECGCSITAQITKGRTYYRCSKAKHRKCKQPYIRQEELTKLLAGVIKEVTINKEILEILKKELRLARSSIDSFRNQALSALKQKQTKLQNKKQNLWDMRIEGEIPKEVFEEKMQEIIAEEERMEESLKQHEKANNNWYEMCSNFLELAFSSYKLFKIGSDEEKRKILSSICSNIILKDKKVIKITYKPPFDILVKKGSRFTWRRVIDAVPTLNLMRDLKTSTITKNLMIFFMTH